LQFYLFENVISVFLKIQGNIVIVNNEPGLVLRPRDFESINQT